jgi:hypothetical protein
VRRAKSTKPSLECVAYHAERNVYTKAVASRHEARHAAAPCARRDWEIPTLERAAHHAERDVYTITIHFLYPYAMRAARWAGISPSRRRWPLDITLCVDITLRVMGWAHFPSFRRSLPGTSLCRHHARRTVSAVSRAERKL